MEQRDPEAHPSVLSGDLHANDQLGEYADNSTMVVSIGSESLHPLYPYPRNVRLDGITISGARVVSTPYGGGVALQMIGEELVIENCLFRDSDQGLASRAYVAAITGCTFTSLGRPPGTGGGGACISISDLINSYDFRRDIDVAVTNCLVAGNRCIGMSISQGNPETVVRNCTIVGNNSRSGIAGGLYGRPDVANCIIWATASRTMGTAAASTASCTSRTATGCTTPVCRASRTSSRSATTSPRTHSSRSPWGRKTSSGAPAATCASDASRPVPTVDPTSSRPSTGPISTATGRPTEPLPFDLDGRSRFVDDRLLPGRADPEPVIDMGAYERDAPVDNREPQPR